MKRRTLVKTVALTILGYAMSRFTRVHAPVLGQDHREMIAAIGEVVLPSTLGSDGRAKAIEAFVTWLDGYKAGVPMSCGYGSQLQNAVVPPSPMLRYPAQFTHLEALAKAKGANFTALPLAD